LEPRWEATFEASSYGFRPGRRCHDAISHIATLTHGNCRKPWVVDADIKGACDNIGHDHLLQTIGEVPGRELIKQWLKAGYVEMGTYHDTDAGTPQGGVISPLRANIALHGMEEALGIRYDRTGRNRGDRALGRYADDVVVLCKTRADAEQVIEILNTWLAERGLNLSEEKTRVVHLTDGFNCLGFTIRQRSNVLRREGTVRLITPSKEGVRRHRDKMRDEWLRLRGKPVATVIDTLKPKITGWANYYRHQVAAVVFRKLDQWMYRREYRYAQYSHPGHSSKWRRQRYWGKLDSKRDDIWVFGDKRTGAYLPKYAWTKIERHPKVKGTASPDDPNLKDYWEERTKTKVKELIPSQQKIAQSQQYVCPICGETLFKDEELQTDHVQPRHKGGKDSYDNLQLLHLDCHKQKTAVDWSKHEPTRKWLRKWLA
jgi:RNA-directed DNA polymerase